jgi:hypothetical protein
MTWHPRFPSPSLLHCCWLCLMFGIPFLFVLHFEPRAALVHHFFFSPRADCCTVYVFCTPIHVRIYILIHVRMACTPDPRVDLHCHPRVDVLHIDPRADLVHTSLFLWSTCGSVYIFLCTFLIINFFLSVFFFAPVCLYLHSHEYNYYIFILLYLRKYTFIPACSVLYAS